MTESSFLPGWQEEMNGINGNKTIKNNLRDRENEFMMFDFSALQINIINDYSQTER